MVGENEAPSVWPYLEQADLIVSCANGLAARLFIEQAAVKLRKPCVQACVQDGRTALGGVITLWAPEANCSCFGCLFYQGTHAIHARGIAASHGYATVAAVATRLVTEMLRSGPSRVAERQNVVAVDLGLLTMQSMSIQPRSTCPTCGGRR